MVRIIERGEDPSHQPIQCRCKNCNTLFEFARTEASAEHDSRELSIVYYIYCPICRRPCYEGTWTR